MAISKQTEQFLEETDRWLAEQQADDRKRNTFKAKVKALGVVPFTVYLAIGVTVLHYFLQP
ncbi:hypothetical protein [Pseudomonas sp.]|jgi:hypothetical protein|uniref:hypothetical protein n=1 Tax=Pseudomonas sp. TaxID=306 RepID=UPI002ED87627